MNLKFFKLSILLLIFLFIISLVQADSSFYTEENTLKFCKCSDATDLIKIKNSGFIDVLHFFYYRTEKSELS